VGAAGVYMAVTLLPALIRDTADREPRGRTVGAWQYPGRNGRPGSGRAALPREGVRTTTLPAVSVQRSA
jgi:hypothetical protein